MEETKKKEFMKAFCCRDNDSLSIQVTFLVVFHGVVPLIARHNTKTHPTLPAHVFCLTAAFRAGSIRTNHTIWVTISLADKVALSESLWQVSQ